MRRYLIIIGITAILWALALSMQPPLPQQSHTPLATKQGVTRLMKATANSEKIGTLNILFIGNSYTFMHSMPQMIINIAASDPKNAIELNVQSITIAGARLKEHWKDGTAAEVLKHRQWDFVILQDQSNWTTEQGGARNNYIYASKLKKIAHDINPKSIITFFKTWPKKKGSEWYSNPSMKNHTISYKYMRNAINHKHSSIVKKLGVQIVPISDYWLYIHDNNLTVDLYEPDGSHPSIAGSYLNALIFYRYFTASKLRDVTYIPPYLQQKTAIQLRQIAALGSLK